MTLGPRRWERCDQKSVAILAEISPGDDGERGSMSMCNSCLKVFKQLNKNWKSRYIEAKI
jgi:hypothetical protein